MGNQGPRSVRVYRDPRHRQVKGTVRVVPTEGYIDVTSPAPDFGEYIGDVLTAIVGGSAFVTYWTYQWQRDGVNIGGATSSTYTVVAADAEHAITCDATPHNGFGAGPMVTSNTINVIEQTRYVTDFSDANYLAGANAAGTATIGTVRLVFKLLSLSLARNTIISRIGPGLAGWEVASNITTNNLSLIVYETGGPGYATVSLPALGAGDVGTLFCVHFTCGAGAGGVLREYLQGAEYGTGQACVGTPVAAGAGTGIWVGSRQPGAGYGGGGWCGLISAAVSPTILTPAQIAADAATIMARTVQIDVPLLGASGEDYEARDLDPSQVTWPDRDGGEVPLTTVGAVTVAVLT